MDHFEGWTTDGQTHTRRALKQYSPAETIAALPYNVHSKAVP